MHSIEPKNINQIKRKGFLVDSKISRINRAKPKVTLKDTIIPIAIINPIGIKNNAVEIVSGKSIFLITML